MRAIVADDEKWVLSEFQNFAEEIPLMESLECFSSGTEVIEYMAANPDSADIIFLDIEMPEMNGLETAQKLKKINSSILIVFVTAYIDRFKDAHLEGFDDFVVKPFDARDIEKTLIKLEPFVTKKNIFEISMFGLLSVARDGVPLQIKRGKTREMIGYLLCSNGQFIKKTDLCQILWGMENPASAASNLRTNISIMKKLVTDAGIPEFFSQTRTHIGINTECVKCDYLDVINGKTEIRNSAFRNRNFMSEFSESQWVIEENDKLEKLLRKQLNGND